MKGINKVMLVGFLGKDPEVRYTASGTCVTTFSIATNAMYRDKNTGEKVDKTTWTNCVGFGKTGEIIGEYTRKGSRVYIEGSLDNQTYEKDGETKYITKVVVKDVVLLNSINDQQENQGNQQNNQTKNKQGNAHNNSSQQYDEQFDDSEIPF